MTILPSEFLWIYAPRNEEELEVVEKTNLDSREFKDKILAALREEDDA